MLLRTLGLNNAERQSAIIRDPLTVSLDTPLIEAIASVSGVSTSCQLLEPLPVLEEALLKARASCILVIEAGTPVGVVTETDIVRWIALGNVIDHVVVQDMMTAQGTTLREAEFTSIPAVLDVLKQQGIRHLPLVNEQGKVVGLLTDTTLQQNTYSIDLLRLRPVSEVMTARIVSAEANATMLAIAQLMVQQCADLVVIIQETDAPAHTENEQSPLRIPIGIITEQDVVQFQALGLNLESYSAESVMNPVIFAVKPEDSLLTAYQIFEQQRIQQVVVTNPRGELRGIVTRNQVVKEPEPSELYPLIEALAQKVLDLESEKIEFHTNQAIELERQVQERTETLCRKIEQDRLLKTVMTQIRLSLNIQDILDAIVREIQIFLGCDRVSICQFYSGSGGITVAEASATEEANRFDQEGVIEVAPALLDASETGMTNGNGTMRLPILVNQQLWGLMIVSFQSVEYSWEHHEIDLLRQLSTQIAIAIRQSSTYQQAKKELADRKQTEERLRESEQRYASLAAAAPVGIFRTDIQGNYLFVNQHWCDMIGLTPDQSLGMGWQQSLHPEDQQGLVEEWNQSIAEDRPFRGEYRCLRPNGSVSWVYGQAVAERNVKGEVIGYVGSTTDISDRKQSEEALRASEAHLSALIKALPDLIMRINREGIYLEFITTSNFNIVGTVRQLVGTHIVESLAPAIAQLRIENIHKALSSRSIQIYEQDLSIDGATQIEEVRVVPYGNDEVLLLVRDISHRKQAELAIKQSEAKSQAVLAAIPDLMFRVGEDGVYRGFVTQHRDIDVISKTFNPIGHSMDEVLPPELAKQQYSYLQQALQTGELQVYEQELRVGDRLQYEEVRIIKSAADEVLFMIRDISDRKQAEAALRESEQTNRTIVESIPDLLIRMDQEGNYSEMLGGSAVRVKTPSGYSNEPELYEVLPPELAEKRLRYTKQAIASNTLQVYEQIFEFTEEQRYEEVRIAPLNTHEVLIIIRDVTDRKQAEIALQDLNQSLELKVEKRTAELRASETQIRAMIEAIPDLLLRVTRQGNCLNYIHSPNQTEVFLPIRQHLSEVLTPQLLEKQLAMIERAIATGDLQVYEHHFQKHDRIVYEEVRVVGISDQEALVIVRDITHRRQTEQENYFLKERLQFLISSSPAMIYSSKPDGDYGATFMSENVETILGYKPEDFVNDSNFWASHIHPEDASKIFADLSILFERGACNHEYRFLHKNGTYLWLQDELRLVRDSAGKPTEIIGYFADISDRKQAEEKISQQLAAIESAVDGIGILKEDKYIYLNQAHLQLFELDHPDALLGKSWKSLYSVEEMQWFEKEVFPALGRDRHWKGETVAIRRDGTSFAQELSLTLTENNLLICVCRDISDRKQYETQLQETNAELARATRLKDEFLANMSHELRTPLNAILGMAEGLQEAVFGSITSQQAKALKTIERSGTHLLELINDILDLAKIEAGQVNLHFISTTISSLCQSSLTFVKQLALQKNLQLNVQVPSYLPSLMVDERRIRQVLINLLSNAVKFTPEGGSISLEVNLEPADPPSTIVPNFIRFSITDTGIGINPEDLQKLFQPFVQVDSALNRQYQGTGLGLSLVKRLVELHGGQVEVTSTVSQGSCFAFKLPCTEVLTTPPNKASSLLFPGISSITEITEASGAAPLILLAEDNEANILTISSYLEAKGYRLMVANNGEAAIALAQTHHPALILMDIQMPGMDGFEAMQHIRKQPELVNIPIIALTALAMVGDRDKCIAAGASDYLTKPVRLKQLSETIQQMLGT